MFCIIFLLRYTKISQIKEVSARVSEGKTFVLKSVKQDKRVRARPRRLRSPRLRRRRPQKDYWGATASAAMARQPEGRRDRANAWQDQRKWRESKNCQHCIINKRGENGEEERAQRTRPVHRRTSSQQSKEVEENLMWTLEWFQLSRVVTRHRCQAANAMTWIGGIKSLKENKGMISFFFIPYLDILKPITKWQRTFFNCFPK